MVIAEGIEDGIRDIDRNRVFTNAVNKKYAELFAQGKPIHPYSLQCKAFSLCPVFKGAY
jgi:hypothetical protein